MYSRMAGNLSAAAAFPGEYSVTASFTPSDMGIQVFSMRTPSLVTYGLGAISIGASAGPEGRVACPGNCGGFAVWSPGEVCGEAGLGACSCAGAAVCGGGDA